MPKKFSEQDKEKWLELFEKEGKTDLWIARKFDCDVRTIKRGLDEARRKRDARTARAELVRDAVRKHQDALMEELNKILKTIEVPAIDFAPLSWLRGGNSVFSPSVPHDSQTSTIRSLLKEHLKRDKSWKALSRWEKEYDSHMTVRKALQKRTVALVEKITGYKLVDKSSGTPPDFYSSCIGDLFFKGVLRRDFGKQAIDIEVRMVADTDRGIVRYQNITLVEAPGSEKKYRDILLKAFEMLQSVPELMQVVKTYEGLPALATEAKREIELITLMGLVPGECPVCYRLGI